MFLHVLLTSAMALQIAAPESRLPEGEARAAHAAVRRGEQVALESILADAARRYPGRVIEIELEDGVYEIEILLSDGRVAELEYRARTGKLIDAEVESPDAD